MHDDFSQNDNICALKSHLNDQKSAQKNTHPLTASQTTLRANEQLRENSIRKKLHCAAEAMAPTLRERRSHTSKISQLTDNSLFDIIDRGFIRTLLPRRYGGLQLAPQDLFEIQIKLAQGCMATAWVTGSYAINSWQLSLFDEEAQDEVWGENPNTLIAAADICAGSARIVDGGFRLTGKWQLVCGVNHCQWVLLSSPMQKQVHGASSSTQQRSSQLSQVNFLVPRQSCQIVNRWNANGLNGAGCNDVVLSDEFVPDYRCYNLSEQMPGNVLASLAGNSQQNHSKNPIYLRELRSRARSSPALGALKDASQIYQQENSDAIMRGGLDTNKIEPQQLKSAGKYFVQYQVPSWECELTAAVTYAERVIDQSETSMRHNSGQLKLIESIDRPITTKFQQQIHFASDIVLGKCVAAVNRLLLASQISSLNNDHPLNRIWLDINTAHHLASQTYKQNASGLV